MRQKRTTITALVVIILALALLAGINWWAHSRTDKKASVETAPQVDNQPDKATAKAPLKLYFIGIGDDGVSGAKVGCGDSLIEITTEPVASQDVIKSTFDRLFDQDDETYGGSGLYNALYQSNLTYQSSEVDGDTVTVKLMGTIKQAGECDAPRIKAELTKAAETAAGVSKATIYINGKSLDQVLSLKS